MVDREECENSGCIWQDVSISKLMLPKCFFPKSNLHGYRVLKTEEIQNSSSIMRIRILNTAIRPFPRTEDDLDVEFIEYGENIFRIRVSFIFKNPLLKES